MGTSAGGGEEASRGLPCSQVGHRGLLIVSYLQRSFINPHGATPLNSKRADELSKHDTLRTDGSGG